MTQKTVEHTYFTLVGWLVGWLKFSVPFQHKYGYIRDDILYVNISSIVVLSVQSPEVWCTEQRINILCKFVDNI